MASKGVHKGSYTGGGGLATGRLASHVQYLLGKEGARVVSDDGHADITDNSTGTAGNGIVDLSPPSVAYDGSGGAGASTQNADASDLQAAIVTVEDALAVLMDAAGDIATLLDIPGNWGEGDGTVDTADTVAAVTKVVGNVTDTDAASFADFYAAAKEVQNNVATVARVVNECAVGVGLEAEPDGSGGVPNVPERDLVSVTDVTADADGTSSVNHDVAETWLSACADAVAALASKLSDVTQVDPLATPTLVAALDEKTDVVPPV